VGYIVETNKQMSERLSFMGVPPIKLGFRAPLVNRVATSWFDRLLSLHASSRSQRCLSTPVGGYSSVIT